MRSPFVRGALSGVAAGLLAATLAFFLLEPALREAVSLEGPAEQALVSRTLQERLGAPLGFAVTGIAFGLVLAAVDRGARPGGTPWRRSLLLAGSLFTAVVAVPQLRYPPNPPGVGDPDTIGDRTMTYLLAMTLGVVVVALVVTAARQLSDSARLDPLRQALLVVGGVTLVAVGWAVLPSDGASADVPAELLWDFRIRSLGVSAALWAALGAVYGALGLREAARAGRPVVV